MASGTFSWRNSWGNKLQRWQFVRCRRLTGGNLRKYLCCFYLLMAKCTGKAMAGKRADAQGRVEPMDQSGEGRYSFSAPDCTGLFQIDTFCCRSAALAC